MTNDHELGKKRPVTKLCVWVCVCVRERERGGEGGSVSIDSGENGLKSIVKGFTLIVYIWKGNLQKRQKYILCGNPANNAIFL